MILRILTDLSTRPTRREPRESEPKEATFKKQSAKFKKTEDKADKNSDIPIKSLGRPPNHRGDIWDDGERCPVRLPTHTHKHTQSDE